MRFNQKPWPWCKLSWYFLNGRSVMLMHNWESLRFHEYNELARENSNQIRLSGIDNSYHFKTISIFLRTLCNYAISPLKIWNSLLWTMASIAELLGNYLDFPVNTTFTYTVTLWVYVTSLTYFGRYLYNIIHIITSIVKVKPNSSKGTFQTRFGHSKKTPN